MEHNPFDSLVSEYESWFVQNKTLFQSELLALKQVIPIGEKGIEIGIGSGIFNRKLKKIIEVDGEMMACSSSLKI